MKTLQASFLLDRIQKDLPGDPMELIELPLLDMLVYPDEEVRRLARLLINRLLELKEISIVVAIPN